MKRAVMSFILVLIMSMGLIAYGNNHSFINAELEAPVRTVSAPELLSAAAHGVIINNKIHSALPG